MNLNLIKIIKLLVITIMELRLIYINIINRLKKTYNTFFILVYVFLFLLLQLVNQINFNDLKNFNFFQLYENTRGIPLNYSRFLEYLYMECVQIVDFFIDYFTHGVNKENNFTANIKDLPLLFILLNILIFFMQNMRNSNNFPLFPSSNRYPDLFSTDFGTSTAKLEEKPNTGILFEDIAGIDQVKAEFVEIVSFLQDSSGFTKVGARIPKGILLLGPPGTGKTLLVKAIANEAMVPFYNTAGAEFVEMFVGIGAARVRDLFRKASSNAPCIVFIDEIDAIGRQRGAGIGSGNDEREQTLNQLLTELDGFRENRGVILIGATNRGNVLDPALLRPGRFDRKVMVNLPNRAGRLDILKVHAKNKLLNEDVSLDQLANRTGGFSGADLANLLNEAAILAVRYQKNTITKNEINESVDRVIAGIPESMMVNTKTKELVAYHEVGHAIVGSIIKNHDQVERITLVPRGGAKGFTWFIPEQEKGLLSRSSLVAQIQASLGGYVTEKVIFGIPEITSGANKDLKKATNIARKIVTRYGMSGLGPITLENNKNELFFRGNFHEPPMLNRVDKEISIILNYYKKIVTNIVQDNRVVIDLASEKLLDNEIIAGKELRKLTNKFSPIFKKSIEY